MMGARMAAPLPFDVCGPLPTGVTVLEASAGTGKTFTIAALAARYVAEGTPLDQILLVTFTRMATGELRDRVRERLVHTEQGLARFQAGALPTDGDEVVALLVRGSEDEVRERHERLVRAIARFDAATIATTHGFCQEVLGGLGIVGDVETDMTFVEDPADLVEEVVDDLFVRRFHRHGDPQFTRDEALRIARAAVANPDARIEPDGAPEHSKEAMRVRFAHVVCEEFERRKRRMSLITYEDLLTRLQDTLAGPGGEAAAERLQARYRVVLVDEFQDTDPVQWDIMRRAFGGGGVALDPDRRPETGDLRLPRGRRLRVPQGALRRRARKRRSRSNWRSDQGLIDAYDVMFGGATLGHEGIVYRRVRRGAGQPDARAVRRAGGGGGAGAGRAPRRAGGHAHEGRRLRERAVRARAHRARPRRRSRGAAVVAGAGRDPRLGRARAPRGDPPGPRGGARAHAPQRRAGAPRRWMRSASRRSSTARAACSAPSRRATGCGLLEALERPAQSTRARSASLTPFLGWTAERVACAGEAEWEEVHRRLHRWARVLRVSGVAALMETITRAEGLPGRVLARADGERALTDLRHVGQLLHATATAEGMGGAALTAWLRQRIAAAARETGDEERTRRLESDAEAVQVLTIHRSKGLEFPIVYCPDLWEPGYIPRDPQPVFFHDPAQDYERTIDVGLEGPDWGRHCRHHEEEQRGEDLRLAYVALTRARHQAVVWWAGSWESRHSALGRLLFARGEDGVVPPSGAATPTDAAAVARFEELALLVPGRISVERSRLAGLPVTWSPALRWRRRICRRRAFSRGLDARWRRTSFSDISAGAYEAARGERARGGGAGGRAAAVVCRASSVAPTRVDGDAARAGGAGSAGRDAGRAAGRHARAPGARGGGLRRAPICRAEMALRIAEGQGWRHVDLGSVRDRRRRPGRGAADAARPAAGWAAPVRRRRARTGSTSSTFELPLVGGDEPTGRLTLAAIAAVLREHLQRRRSVARVRRAARRPGAASRACAATSPAASTSSCGCAGPTASRRASRSPTTRRTGSRRRGEELTAWHHRPSALASEMRHRHYGLQALLYTVALHRYLRWRVPGLLPGHAHRRRALPLPPRDDRTPTRRWSTVSRAACSPGARRVRWSRR